MDWSTLIAEIFQVCLIPLLGILVKYLVSFINIKSTEIIDRTDNKMAAKYIQMANDTINACVIATNQTYVNSLKQQGKFDAEAQKVAFKLTYDAVMNILTNEAQNYLNNAFGDLTKYITTQIEASVNNEKPAQSYLLKKE